MISTLYFSDLFFCAERIPLQRVWREDVERNRLSITAAASLLAVDPSQGPKAPQLLYSISSLVPRISPEGGSVMDDRPSVSSPTSQYDDFLFASICEEANGMRLSVLSALARMNVDPWDEATRLAAMPKAVAERTLVSILDLVSGRRWNPSEAKVVAARLVRLLPQQGDGATIAAADPARVGARRTNYWWGWVVFAIAISLLSPRHHATTTDAGASASKSSATSPLKSGSTNSTSPGANAH